MILRRLTHHMKSESWSAVAIEFVLVVLGVFLGIAAANWNEERLERRENEQLLHQVDGTLTQFLTFFDVLDQYYAITATYGDRAIAGWQGETSVTDEQFVIAAYQASQIVGLANNAGVFGAIFGAENLRDIEDPVIRENLAAVMTYDYALVDLRSVATRYREEVRKTIPHALQQAIRDRCGDRLKKEGYFELPTSCDLKLPPDEARRAASALRARPELLGELHWHRAAVANQIANVAALRGIVRPLAERLGSDSE